MDEGRQKNMQWLEEIIDEGLKQKLVHATASRGKIFEEQKALSDLETLENNGVNSLNTMVNLGSEVYIRAQVPDTHVRIHRRWPCLLCGVHPEFISQRKERVEKQLEDVTGVITQIKLAHYQIQQILKSS